MDYRKKFDGEYADFFKKISDIVETNRAMQSKEGLAYLLSKTLIESMGEPADQETETDKRFRGLLHHLEKYENGELNKGFVNLYNAVQKSKRFYLVAGETTKQLVRKPV